MTYSINVITSPVNLIDPMCSSPNIFNSFIYIPLISETFFISQTRILN